MAIHVDVYADLNQRSVAQASSQLNTAFHDITVNVNVDANQATRSLRNFNTTAKTTNDVIQELGTTAFKTGRGLATLGAGPAVLGLLELVKVGTAATQALWLLPAAASAAAAGIGTLAIATHGFGDAIKDMGDPKKFAEGLAQLSPNAQQAALAIKSLVDGPLGELKKATQDNFFAGISDQLQNLSRIYVPEIRKMTTGIAGAFNEAMQGVGNLLATPAVQGQLSTTMANITQAFQNAAPAAQSLAQAFIDISEVGSGFLPNFGTQIANAADQFANFIREARQSGDLAKWIQQGIDAVKNLGTAASELAQIFYRVFGPGTTEDINNINTGMSSLDQTIQSYNADLTKIADIIGLLSLDTHTWSVKWNEEMMAMQGPLGALRDGILDIPEAFSSALNGVINAFNGFIDHLNSAVQGSVLGTILENIPGGLDRGSLNIPHIPNVGAGGDWGGYQSTAPVAGAPPNAQRERRGRAPIVPGGPPPGQRFGVPPVPPDGAGGKPSQKEHRDALIAGLDPALWQVDPFGGMAGMQMGPGANPQDVLEQQRNVISEAHDVEEANKNLLALQQDNTATAQDIDEAKWKQVEEGWQLQEAQVKLAEKMAGTAKDVKAGSDELSAALDPDLGLGKGLAGLADNLVRFLGKLALAGPMAKGQQFINQQEAATGIKGGYGLFGMMGAQNLSQGLSPLLGQPLTGAGPASTGGGYQSAYTPTGGMYPSATAAAGALPTQPTGGMDPISAYAQRYSGGQYSWGGSDLAAGLSDCSGAVSDLVEIITQGQATSERLFATGNAGSVLSSLGAVSGAVPGALQIGWVNGGPGGGHMRATLPNGVAFESGGGTGQGATYGGAAKGAAGMPNIMSLPIPGGAPATVGSGPLGTPLPTAPTRSGWFPSGGGGGGGDLFSPENTNPGLNFTGDPMSPSRPWAPGMIGRGLGPPGGTGQFNPGIRIDTSRAGVAPPSTSGGALSDIARGGGFGGPGIGGALGMNPALHGGGGPVGPGAPPRVAGQGPTRIGGLAPPASINPGGEGFGIMPGGTIDSIIQGSIQAAGAAGGMFGGGAGGAAAAQAVQTAIKLGNRAIQFGGEAAGIGVSGLMETFLPTGGSELANNNWLTRIGGAIAAGAPAIPNLAGGKTGEMQQQGPLTPEQVAAAQKDPNLAAFQNAPVVGTLNYNNIGAPEDRAGADLTHHLSQVQQAPMGGMGKPR